MYFFKVQFNFIHVVNFFLKIFIPKVYGPGLSIYVKYFIFLCGQYVEYFQHISLYLTQQERVDILKLFTQKSYKFCLNRKELLHVNLLYCRHFT